MPKIVPIIKKIDPEEKIKRANLERYRLEKDKLARKLAVLEASCLAGGKSCKYKDSICTVCNTPSSHFIYWW